MNENELSEREGFELALADFGRTAGVELKLDAEGTCTVGVDDGDVNVNIRYLDGGADTIVCWATVGFLPDDRYAGMRACRLLKWNDFQQKTRRFTLGADAETGRLVAAGRFPAFAFDDACRLGTLISMLVETVHDVREELDNVYPPEFEDLSPADILEDDRS